MFECFSGPQKEEEEQKNVKQTYAKYNMFTPLNSALLSLWLNDVINSWWKGKLSYSTTFMHNFISYVLLYDEAMPPSSVSAPSSLFASFVPSR